MFVTFLCYPRSPRQLLPSPLSSFGFELNTPQDPINLPVPPLYFTFVGRCPRIGSARSQLPRVHFPRVVPHVTAAGTPHAPASPRVTLLFPSFPQASVRVDTELNAVRLLLWKRLCYPLDQ